MTIKECYEQAVRNELTDLYALILFLVFEKKVLTFDDPEHKLNFYLQDKFKLRMNAFIKKYKKDNRINYKATVYEISVKKRNYNTIYVLAQDEMQAKSFARSLFYKPLEINSCDTDLLMTRYNSKNEVINITIKNLREHQKLIPTFLGGF